MKRVARITYDGPDRHVGVRTRVVTRAARYGAPISAAIDFDGGTVRFEVTAYNDGRIEFTDTSTVNGQRRTQMLWEGRYAT